MTGALQPIGPANNLPAGSIPAGNSPFGGGQYPALPILDQGGVTVDAFQGGARNGAIDKACRPRQQDGHVSRACGPECAGAIQENAPPEIDGKALVRVPFGHHALAQLNRSPGFRSLQRSPIAGSPGLAFQPGTEALAAAGPEAKATPRFPHDTQAAHIGHIRHGSQQMVRKHGQKREHLPFGIVL